MNYLEQLFSAGGTMEEMKLPTTLPLVYTHCVVKMLGIEGILTKH